MVRIRLFFIVALILVFSLAACGTSGGGTAGNDAQQQAADQFLSDRGGGSQSPAVLGTVEAVDGTTVTLKSPDGSTTKVDLSSAKVQKEVASNTADIKVGDPITAFGVEKDNVYEAQRVQLGGGGLMGSGAAGGPPAGVPVAGPGGVPVGGPGGEAPAGQAPPPGGQGMVGSNGDRPAAPVVGKVEKVDGNTLTVKSDDGKSTTVQLRSDVEVVRQTEVSTDEVKTGTTVMAFGAKEGDVFKAQTAQLITAAPSAP